MNVTQKNHDVKKHVILTNITEKITYFDYIVNISVNLGNKSSFIVS